MCKDGKYFLETLPTITNYELLNFSKKSGILGLYPNLKDEILYKDSFYIKGFDYEKQDTYKFKILEKAIDESKTINFNYNEKNRVANPYKMLNLNGIWYLIATENNKIKNFTISKILDLKLRDKFKKEAKFINLIDKNSNTFISENLITAEILISHKIAEFIKRRNIFPNQKILKEFDNGDILLEIKASFEPEILGMISYWLPDISIVKPLYLKEKLIKNLKNYLENEKL